MATTSSSTRPDWAGAARLPPPPPSPQGRFPQAKGAGLGRLPPLVARFPRAVLTRASFPLLQVGASGWSSYKPGSVVAPRLRWLCREAEQQPLPVVDSTLVHSSQHSPGRLTRSELPLSWLDGRGAAPMNGRFL